MRTNRAAIGARIRVVVPTGLSERSIHRTVGSGAHFGSSTLRQEIGLGPATTIKRVEILWPVTGETQLLEDLEINTCYHVREGSEPEKVALGSFKWPAASGA